MKVLYPISLLQYIISYKFTHVTGKEAIKTKRFKINDNIAGRYLMVSDILFQEPYKSMSNDERMVYSILVERTRLSQKKTLEAQAKNDRIWLNEMGEVYIIYPIKDLGQRCGLKKTKVSRILQSLAQYSLLDIVHRGQGKASILYVGMPELPDTGKKNPTNGTTNCKYGNLDSRKQEPRFPSRGRSNSDATHSDSNQPDGDTYIEDTKERANMYVNPPHVENIIPPSLEVVTSYCAHRHNNIDPEEFIDYYQARGWKGVCDWQAMIRQWERRIERQKLEQNRLPGNPKSVFQRALANCKEENVSHELRMEG